MLSPLIVLAAVARGIRTARAGGTTSAGRRRHHTSSSAVDRAADRAASAAAAAGKPVPPQTGGSPGVESPLALGRAGWRATLKRTLTEVRRDRITLTAAGLSFFWFLSVFPTLVAALAFLDVVNAGPRVISGIQRVVGVALPEDAARVLTAAISNLGEEPRKASVVASLAGVGLALWSASSGMVALQLGLDVAYDVAKERSFLRKRLYAFGLVAASMLFGGFATALIIFGQPIGVWLGENLPIGPFFVRLWTALRWLVALILLTLLMALFYYAGPNRDSPNWKWITPGGILAMGVWVAASLGFSFYVRNFGRYGETYGSLAGVVVLILWLFFAGFAMLLGAELNSELERQSAARAESAARLATSRSPAA